MHHQAFTKLVRMEQEQAEKDRKKDEEERRRKREAEKRKKRMLEAAFDGDNDEMLNIISEVNWCGHIYDDKFSYWIRLIH